MAPIVFRTASSVPKVSVVDFPGNSTVRSSPVVRKTCPSEQAAMNSGCNQFENLFAYRLPVSIGILSQLVDTDDCDGESSCRVARSLRHKPGDRECR